MFSRKERVPRVPIEGESPAALELKKFGNALGRWAYSRFINAESSIEVKKSFLSRLGQRQKLLSAKWEEGGGSFTAEFFELQKGIGYRFHRVEGVFGEGEGQEEITIGSNEQGIQEISLKGASLMEGLYPSAIHLGTDSCRISLRQSGGELAYSTRIGFDGTSRPIILPPHNLIRILQTITDKFFTPEVREALMSSV